MKCYVVGCKFSTTNHSTISPGITFHNFPDEPEGRTQWLRALGAHHADDHAVVCSEHFCSEDLYLGDGGDVCVRAGAIPRDFQVCIICLSTEGKFHDVRTQSLRQAYENITGITPSPRLQARVCAVCAMCARRLLNHDRFRRAAISAHSMLTDALASCHQITLKQIEEIDRLEQKLLPKLSFKHNEPHCFDVFSEENYDLSRSINETGTIPIHEVNIPEEAKIYENDTQDSIKSEVNSLRDSVENPIADAVEDNTFTSDDDRPILPRNFKKKLTKIKKISGKKKKKPMSEKEPKVDKRKKLLGDDLDDKIFSSTLLSGDEQIQEFQKRMHSSNYKNAVYKCDSCFKGFLDEDAYNNHMVRHTDQCGSFACAICRIRFQQAHALRNHVTSHAQKFACKCCAYVTYRKQTAKLHEEWHNGTKYQCPHCQEEFLKFTTYMGHVRLKHPSGCVCQLCGRSFVSDKGLRLHTKLKHRLDDGSVIPEDGPCCERCGVRFLSVEAHQRHLQVSARHKDTLDNESKQSAQKRPRKPREVKDDLSTDTTLDKKKKRAPAVKPEGPIPCEQCNMQLEDSRAYYKHFRRMHPDKNRTNYPSMKSPCMCERCGRMFQTLALLVDHSHVHSSEKRFKCALCGKRFQQRQRLVAHAHVHGARRTRYQCAVCGKHFTTHSNRQRHMVSHTGLKPFKCEMCGKCFKHASEKRAHVAYVHLKKPWPKRARHKRTGDYDAATVTREPQQTEIALVEPPWAACAQPKVTWGQTDLSAST